MSEKLEIEIHDKISKIVISHKRGELSYNAGLEILEKMGLKQIDIVLPQNLEGLNIDG